MKNSEIAFPKNCDSNHSNTQKKLNQLIFTFKVYNGDGYEAIILLKMDLYLLDHIIRSHVDNTTFNYGFIFF